MKKGKKMKKMKKKTLEEQSLNEIGINLFVKV